MTRRPRTRPRAETTSHPATIRDPLPASWRITTFRAMSRTPLNFRDLFAAAVLVLLGVLASWPVMPLHRMATHLYVGDATIFAYALGWGADTWWHNPIHYFDLPAFYPFKPALANTDGLILQSILTTPVWLATHNFALTFNVGMVLSLIFTLLAPYLTLRILTPVPRVACVAASVVMAVTTDRYWHSAGHINLLWYGIVSFGFLGGWMLAASQRWSAAIITAAAALAGLFFSWYLLVFTILSAAAGLIAAFAVLGLRALLPRGGRSFGRVAALSAAAGLMTLALATPIIVVYAKARTEDAATARGSITEAASYRASLRGWFLPPAAPGRLVTLAGRALPAPLRKATRDEDSQFIGFLLFALLAAEAARVACAVVRRRVQPLDRLSLFSGVAAFACMATSFGPYLVTPWGILHAPYWYLHRLFLEHTGFFRNPARFAFLFQFFSCVSVAILLTALANRWKRCLLPVSALVIVIVFLEHWPLEMPPRYVPASLDSIAELSRREPSGREPFAALPDHRNCMAGLSTWPQWRPMMNGWPSSALFPAHENMMQVLEEFPTTRSLALLDRTGVKWIATIDTAASGRAVSDSRLSTFATSTTVLASIREPGKAQAQWTTAIESAAAERSRQRASQYPGSMTTIAEFKGKPRWKAYPYAARMEYQEGRGIVLTSEGNFFAAIAFAPEQPVSPIAADAIELDLVSNADLTQCGTKCYYMFAGKQFGERDSQAGTIRATGPGRFVASIPLWKSLTWLVGDGDKLDGLPSATQMRIDFTNLPPEGNPPVTIERIRGVRLAPAPTPPL